MKDKYKWTLCNKLDREFQNFLSKNKSFCQKDWKLAIHSGGLLDPTLQQSVMGIRREG